MRIFFSILSIITVQYLCAQNFNKVQVGNIYWADRNLNVSTFSNGDPINYAKTPTEWEDFFRQGKPAFTSLNYNSKNDSIHGKIYNWFAVVDPRGLAPEGWMVPSMQDWVKFKSRINYDTLCKCYPPIFRSADKLRSKIEWKSDVIGENYLNMNILPSGYLRNDGRHEGRFFQVSYWTCTPENAANIIGDSYSTFYAVFNYKKSDIYFDKNFDSNGHFVRCATGQQEYFYPAQVQENNSIQNTPVDSDSDETTTEEEDEKPKKKKKKKKSKE